MTSKEKLEALNYIWFYEPTCQEEQDKRDAIIKELKQDLEVLEILKNKRVNINKISKVKNLCNYNSICAIGTDLTFEEYKTIKNWLERKE